MPDLSGAQSALSRRLEVKGSSPYQSNWTSRQSRRGGAPPARNVLKAERRASIRVGTFSNEVPVAAERTNVCM